MVRLKSFTLIEVLVSVGIFAMVMSMALALIINIIHYTTKTAIQRQVNQEARNISDTVSQKAKLAMGRPDIPNSVPEVPAQPGIQVDPATNDLVITDASSQQTTFQLLTAGTILETVTRFDFNSTVTLPPKLDIILILDRTGSMNDCATPSTPCPLTKLQALKTAADNFVDIIKNSAIATGDPSYHRIGMVAYGSKQYYLGTPPVLHDDPEMKKYNLDSDFDGLKTDINNLTAEGSTWMGEALNQANGIVSNDSNPRSDSSRYYVLMSDGCANMPGCYYKGSFGSYYPYCEKVSDSGNCNSNIISPPSAVCKWKQPITDAVNFAKDRPPSGLGVDIFSLGFGSGNTNDRVGEACFDEATLKTVPGPTGTYFAASSAEDLNDDFTIIAQMLTGIETNKIPTTYNLSSTAVNVTAFGYNVYGDPAQPFLELDITVRSKDWDSSPEWKKAEVHLKTVISSRDYSKD